MQKAVSSPKLKYFTTEWLIVFSQQDGVWALKTPQDIVLATNKEVRMSTDFFVHGHEDTHIYRCWNDMNCQVTVYLSSPNFAPAVCER